MNARGLSGLIIALATAGAFVPASVSAAEKVTIGFAAALSGEAAAFGVNMRNGVELAVKQLNAANDGITYEIVAADDRGDAREGVLIAQRFCSDSNIDVVMGYSFSSIALAAVPIYDQCGLPVLASAVTSPDLSGVSAFFRRNVLTDAVQGTLMGKYAVEKLGKKQISILYQQDDYGIGVAEAFQNAVEEAGGEVVSSEGYLLGSKDFKTQLTKIRAGKPDALFIGGFYTEAAKIAEQGRALGLDVQFLGTDGSLNPELMTLGGNAVEGMIVYGMFDPSVETPTTTPFIQGYREAHNEDPSAWAALGYDATMAVAAAAKSADAAGDISRSALNDALHEIKDLPGVTGPTTFDENGDRSGTLYFLQVKSGRFTLVQ